LAPHRRQEQSQMAMWHIALRCLRALVAVAPPQ